MWMNASKRRMIVTKMPIARTRLVHTTAPVTQDTMVMDSTAPISMNVTIKATLVTNMLCVRTPKALSIVLARMDTRETDITVQVSMSMWPYSFSKSSRY